LSGGIDALRRNAARIVAIVVVSGLYGFSRMPELPAAERQALAERFGFTMMELAEWAEGPVQTRRSVNPSLERHAGWMSGVGAGVALADLDGDLRPELYYANDFGPDRLFHNRSEKGAIRFALLEGERHLTTPRSKVLGGDSFKGMGVDFADLNDDGRLDFFVSNISAEHALLESHFLFVSTGDVSGMREGVAP
jgi:hypothetical protein